MDDKVAIGGAFKDSLHRNNKSIRQDRADAIIEDTEMVYKREMEDIGIKVKRLQRAQENLIDLSPTDARSLVLASDFDADDFTQKDLDFGLQIRNEIIKLEIATDRYNRLFGAAE